VLAFRKGVVGEIHAFMERRRSREARGAAKPLASTAADAPANP